ncbi:hypothetical protein LAV72_07205 [Lysinibacillus xylanilyticus]|uniref:hypothetical protein n=1 Tax=Lysinibacillus xylanilyticus TaxID=582475 RepID=UPI002B255EF2|nr:hypothetical protein [Lysinibacillus xylanilyticus]MEB2299409.1 hypothetical protein [Lysinibacillus xylanilyticus]
MNDKKKGKLQVTVIVLMILILVAAFVLFFLGHYSIAFVSFGIFIVGINSGWDSTVIPSFFYSTPMKELNHLSFSVVKCLFLRFMDG